jgi:hypothetical protein
MRDVPTSFGWSFFPATRLLSASKATTTADILDQFKRQTEKLDSMSLSVP